jgi:hypothetical protein
MEIISKPIVVVYQARLSLVTAASYLSGEETSAVDERSVEHRHGEN